MDENRLPSWLPKEQPKQALTIIGIVLLLAALPIAALASADGKDDSGPFGHGPDTIIDEEPIDPRVGPPVVTVPRTPPPTTTTPTVPTPTTPAPAPAPTPAPAPSPTPGPSQPVEKPPVIRDIGETATDEGVDFEVTSVRLVKSLPADRYQEGQKFRAPGGGHLVVAKVTYTNHTGEALDPFCGGSSARVVDQYDRPHEVDDLKLYEIPGNDVICSGDDTPDGESDKVILAFELPKGRDLKSIELYNGKTTDYDGQASFVRFRAR